MINHENDIQVVELNSDGLKNVRKQILVGPNDGFDGYMRMFILSESGFTPYHTHDWYHMNYIVEGEGVLIIEGEENQITKGSVAYVPAGVKHGFKNTGKENLKFLCLVPPHGDVY